jgi:GNAT superfamily N-acetyltransferase
MPPRRAPAGPKLAIHPLTPDRWPDLVKLFGPSGGCAGCWCTWWRYTKTEFSAGAGGGNRRRQERYVKAGNVAGLLAYSMDPPRSPPGSARGRAPGRGGEPVGWIAIEPRQAYPRLARSRTLAPVDDRPVWSITCFFVAREHRGKGITRALIEAAVKYARSRGASIVEAYPVDPGGELADARAYHGVASTFLALGFREVARRIRTRPIVRKAVEERRSRSTDGD